MVVRNRWCGMLSVGWLLVSLSLVVSGDSQYGRSRPVLRLFCVSISLVVSGSSQPTMWNLVRLSIVVAVIVGCEWGLTTNDTGLSVGGWLLLLLSLVVSGRSQPVVFLCVGAGTAIVNLFCYESRLTTDACRRPSDPWQVTSENSTDAGRIPETDIRLLRGGYRE